MHNSINPARDKYVIGYIMFLKPEFPIASQVGNILPATSDEVVHPDDFVSICQQAVAHMGAEEARGSGDQNSHDNTSIRVGLLPV
jgi:hypothetical protein